MTPFTEDDPAGFGSEPARLELHLEAPQGAQAARLVVRGALCIPTVPLLYEKFGLLLQHPKLERIDLDLTAVTSADSSAVAALSVFARQCETVGLALNLSSASDELRKLAALMPREAHPPPEESTRRNPFEWLGGYSLRSWKQLGEFYDTFTDAAFALARVVTGRFPPRGSLTTQAVRIGVDALPIVCLLSLLLGLVLAFQAADQLKEFGATIYTADLVGIGMFREFGPILTGIVLAGRSGSAIAAELGTMRVNEEIDALQTMGIDPSRFLVLPRLLALLIVQPALTLMSNLVGTFGGFLIGMLYLAIPADAYWNQSLVAIEAGDLFQGLSKSLIFAALIGVIACYCGMAVRGGAASVGQATTRAVVVSIFMLIVADSIFTTITTVIG